MKKSFYITVWVILLIPHYMSALTSALESNNLSFRGDFDSFEISNDKSTELTSSIIKIAEYATTAEPGKAELPIYTQLISLPKTGNFVLENLTYDYDERVLDYPLQHFGWEDRCTRDEEFYKINDWYPKEIVSIGSPVIMRGYRFCQVSVAAVQYNPAKNIIRILKNVNAEFTVDYKINENPLTDTKSRPSSSFSKIASEHIYGIEKSNIKDTGCYLIIAPDACISTLEYLAEWKRKLGHEVVLTPLSEIGDSPSAYTIKFYIQDAYDNWDVPPEYVLLVGDVTGSFIIPAFYVEGYATQWDVSDHPYTLLEGDDYFPEIYIGRFPIRSLMECATVINKIIHYESTFTEGRWYKKALMISGFFYDYYTSYITKMNVRDKLLNFGFDEVDTFIYPYTTGTQQILSMIDGGYSFINFRGFGYYYYWDNGEMILESDNIYDLNNGYMLPMITSITCGGGDFAAEGIHRCFGEAWLTAGTTTMPKGAIGFIGPSEYDTKTPWNNCNDIGIYQGITHEGIHRCGEMLLRGKMELYNNYPHNHAWGGAEDSDQFYFYIYGLLGDPGLQVWTDTPDSISLMCCDSISCNQNYISVEIDVNDECSDFMVTLTQDDSLVTKGFTNANGNIIFNGNFIPDTYEVTASKDGYLPETREITLYTNESLELTNTVFIDEPISGNTIEYMFELSNPTLYNAEDISVLIASNDEEIEIITDSIYINYIQFQGSYTCQNLYFSINEKWLGRTESNISVQVNSTLGNQSFMIPLEIKSPELVTSQCIVQNNDCCLIQGQEDNVFIELANTGTWETDLFDVLLICTNDKATITQNESYYTTISPNGNGVNALPFSVLPHQILTGESVLFEMQVFKNDSLVQVLQFSVPVGVVCESSPTFSKYGYFAIENSDIGILEAPAYDWIELDPALGGEGTLINGVFITSDGYIRTLDLPFDLVYFGYFYDEITICSNGWVSFNNDLVYHRNKTIPSGNGPAAMIAPFWDDLEDGEIFAWFDEIDHKFIIQWQEFLNVYNPDVKETFQIILFDPEFYPTVNGNVEILFQYKSISNIDQDDNYATVGIENFSQNDGVLITYSNIYSPTAHELADETAILFTIEESPELPLLEVTPVQFNYSLSPDTTITSYFTINNNSSTDLSYFLSTSHYIDKETENGGKNIENDFILASTSYYYPSQPMYIYCYLYHNSSDGEGIEGVTLDFPDGVFVNDGTTINTLIYNGQTGYGAEAKWGYGQGTPIYQAGINSFGINVTIDDTITSPISIDWLIEGTEIGGPPHSVEGEFTLEPSNDEHLWITYPNGGETLVYSLVDTIRWTYFGDIENVSLYIRTDPWSNWELIVENIPNIGYYPYTVNADISDSCIINVRDADGYAYDISDDFFSINIFDITHPFDGDVLSYNTTDTLCWDYSGIYDNVVIELSHDNGLNWELLNDDVPNTGQFVYMVSGPPSEWCKFKIISPDYAVSNTSKGHFTIVDPAVSWISLGENSGIINSGESKNISFEINTHGLEAGSYYAFVSVKSSIGQKIPILVNLDIVYSVDDTISNIPSIHNAPNPFTSSTKISYYLKENLTKEVTISIYNIKGQLVREITNPESIKGLNKVIWDGKDSNGKKQASGLYFYRVKSGNEVLGTSKCLLIDN